MYSSAVFTGVDLFTLKFYMDRVVPTNHSWQQKTRDTGLPDGKDRALLCSLVLTQYRSVTHGQTDGFPVAYTALAKLCFAERCKMLLITLQHSLVPGAACCMWTTLLKLRV